MKYNFKTYIFLILNKKDDNLLLIFFRRMQKDKNTKK